MRRNVWLELVPRKTGNNSSSSRATQRLLPKVGGVIGVANCIMNTAYIDNMLHPSQSISSSSSPAHVKKEEKKAELLKKDPLQTTRESERRKSEDAYAAMMFKIDLDIISTGGADSQRSQLLARTFRGVVADEQVVMEPCAEVEMNLFIVNGDDEGSKKTGVGTHEILFLPIEYRYRTVPIYCTMYSTWYRTVPGTVSVTGTTYL